MSRVCLQCNKWQAARDDLCLLCRGLLGVVQVSKQENFTSSDFSLAVGQVNSLLGNLTSRVVGVPGPRLSSGSTFRRDNSPHSGRGGTSSSFKEGTPRDPPPERPRTSHAQNLVRTSKLSRPVPTNRDKKLRGERSDTADENQGAGGVTEPTPLLHGNAPAKESRKTRRTRKGTS